MTTEKDKTSEKPVIGRYAFAMFDVLGFSDWVESTELQMILDAYRRLLERKEAGSNLQISLSHL